MDTQLYVYTLILYMALINLVSWYAFKRDKTLAQKRKQRITEKTLFLSAFLGGGLGAVAGMHMFSHKTKKPAFLLGLPLIALVNIIFFLMVLGRIL